MVYFTVGLCEMNQSFTTHSKNPGLYNVNRPDFQG